MTDRVWAKSSSSKRERSVNHKWQLQANSSSKKRISSNKSVEDYSLQSRWCTNSKQ